MALLMKKKISNLEYVLERYINETRKSQAKIDEQLKQTDDEIRKLQESQAKTDEQLKQTDDEIRKLQESQAKTDKQIRKLFKHFKNYEDNWGKLIEAMFEPATIRVFNERGVMINSVAKNVIVKTKSDEGEKQEMEIDIFLRNTDTIILVEVKTTLRVDQVKEHIDRRLNRFKQFFPEYKDKKLYGAVAYINVSESADKYAYKHGLFVLTLKGENIEIKNDEKFVPKDYNLNIAQATKLVNQSLKDFLQFARYNS